VTVQTSCLNSGGPNVAVSTRARLVAGEIYAGAWGVWYARCAIGVKHPLSMAVATWLMGGAASRTVNMTSNAPGPMTSANADPGASYLALVIAVVSSSVDAVTAANIMAVHPHVAETASTEEEKKQQQPGGHASGTHLRCTCLHGL
jgi:hypothetical protein